LWFNSQNLEVTEQNAFQSRVFDSIIYKHVASTPPGNISNSISCPPKGLTLILHCVVFVEALTIGELYCAHRHNTEVISAKANHENDTVNYTSLLSKVNYKFPIREAIYLSVSVG